MVPHRFRILALVLFALAESTLTVLAAKGILDAETAVAIGGTLLGLGTALGLVDVTAVERRRRDPSRPALVDDVRREDDIDAAHIAQAVHDARHRGPTDTLLALGLAIVVGAAALTSGCGAGALGMQADLIAMGGIATAELDQALVDARAQDLDGVLERAAAECGSSGCTPERAEAYRAELAERERVWTPALKCRAPVVQALRTWSDSLETAARVNDDSLALDLLVRWGARFVAVFGGVSQCIEAADPSLEVPDLPGLPPSLLSGLTSGGEA